MKTNMDVLDFRLDILLAKKEKFKYIHLLSLRC